MNKLLCIVAGQRAGTTALQTALENTGQFRNFSEIFHTAPNPNIEGSFLHWIRQESVPLEALSSHGSVLELTNAYLEHLSGLAASRHVLMDVKLNSWQVVAPFWRYPHETPFFMQRLMQLNAGFIFVIRRNISDQILSEEIAVRAKKWHNLDAQDFEEPVAIDIQAVQNRAEAVLQAEKFLFGKLKTYRHVFPVAYEDLYDDDGCVNAGIHDWLIRRFDIPIEPRIKPLIRKNQVDKTALITNYSEIRQTIDAMVSAHGRAF